MSFFFPHAEQAEDQRLAGPILTLHVLLRAVPMGAVAGTGVFGLRSGLSSRKGATTTTTSSTLSSVPFPSTAASAGHRPRQLSGPNRPAMVRLLRASGTGTAASLALLSAALAARMRGREHVEWQDRAWRLLANRGQVAVDAWTVGGMLLGGGYGAVLARTRPLGATGVLGASGLGGALGVAGYCVWRCGMGGGKWDD